MLRELVPEHDFHLWSRRQPLPLLSDNEKTDIKGLVLFPAVGPHVRMVFRFLPEFGDSWLFTKAMTDIWPF